MSFSNPTNISYSFPVALANVTWTIQAPRGMTSARMVDMNLATTTTWTATTTSSLLKVGYPNSLSAMGLLTFGTTAAGTALGLADQYKRDSNPLSPVARLGAATNPVAVASESTEILGPVTVTYVANTGGTPAGAGVATVTLAWFAL
jgi:hypothetical protein